jgi:hypothetical protein
MNEDEQKLDKILKEIKEHEGQTTLWQDWVWIHRLQIEKPTWAINIFKQNGIEIA